MNNNCELDNGVYNKFMQSSRASINFSPSQQEDDDRSDGLSGGDSLQLSFNKKKVDECTENEIDEQVEEEIRLEQDKRERGEFSEFERVTHEIEGISTHFYLSLNFVDIDNSKQKEVIDMIIVDEIAQFGYPEEFIVKSIENNEINYATASYYLLKKQLITDY